MYTSILHWFSFEDEGQELNAPICKKIKRGVYLPPCFSLYTLHDVVKVKGNKPDRCVWGCHITSVCLFHCPSQDKPVSWGGTAVLIKALLSVQGVWGPRTLPCQPHISLHSNPAASHSLCACALQIWVIDHSNLQPWMKSHINNQENSKCVPQKHKTARLSSLECHIQRLEPIHETRKIKKKIKFLSFVYCCMQVRLVRQQRQLWIMQKQCK